MTFGIIVAVCYFAYILSEIHKTLFAIFQLLQAMNRRAQRP